MEAMFDYPSTKGERKKGRSLDAPTCLYTGCRPNKAIHLAAVQPQPARIATQPGPTLNLNPHRSLLNPLRRLGPSPSPPPIKRARSLERNNQVLVASVGAFCGTE